MYREIRTAPELVGAPRADIVRTIQAHFQAALAVEQAARTVGWTPALRATASRHDAEAYALQDLAAGRPVKPVASSLPTRKLAAARALLR